MTGVSPKRVSLFSHTGLALMFATAIANRNRREAEEAKPFNGEITRHQRNELKAAGDRRHHMNGRYQRGEKFQDSRGRWYQVAADGSYRRLRRVA